MSKGLARLLSGGRSETAQAQAAAAAEAEDNEAAEAQDDDAQEEDDEEAATSQEDEAQEEEDEDEEEMEEQSSATSNAANAAAGVAKAITKLPQCARAQGEKVAAAARQAALAHVAAIVQSKEAKGRESAALALALDSGVSIETARRLLAGLPKGGSFHERLNAGDQPDLGPGGSGAGGAGGDGLDAMAKRIAGYANGKAA